jgi:hypothetical protein
LPSLVSPSWSPSLSTGEPNEAPLALEADALDDEDDLEPDVEEVASAL